MEGNCIFVDWCAHERLFSVLEIFSIRLNVFGEYNMPLKDSYQLVIVAKDY